SYYYTTACSLDNMKGINAAISMSNLGDAYVVTDGYPILAVFNTDENAVPLGTLGTTYFSGRKGTEAEPFLISTEQHLKNALDFFGANLYYKLTNDIYVEADAWFAAPSHDGYTNSRGVVGAFSGTLDGNGYAVKGICYPKVGNWDNNKYTYSTGLIPVIDNATVKNITISNSYFTASSLLDSSYNLKTQAYISPVCGIVKEAAEFSNVTVDESVTVEYSAKVGYNTWAVIGGIVAISNSDKNNNQLTKITNCGVSFVLTGNSENINGVRRAGLVGEFGWSCNLEISNCYSKGLPTLNYPGGDQGSFNLSNMFSDTDYTATGLKFTTKQTLLESLDSGSLIEAGLDSNSWYSVDGKTPMLRIRGEAIADVDENGVGLEAGDLVALRKHLLSIDTKKNSDVNRDDTVDIRDLVNLKKRIAGAIQVVKDKKIAFTFDDGPNSLVPQICDAFEKYNGKATFFVVGNNVSANTEYLNYAIDKGFEIGNHSMTHATFTNITLDEVRTEISNCDKAVKDATGYEMTLLRLPGLAINDEVNNMITNELGRPMLSGYGGGESDTATVNDIKNTILSNAKDGRVILLHCQAKTVSALDSALNELTMRGYEFVTVSELFGGTENIPLGYQVKEVQ
ncbi:MAG: polysaccharide deacetylase family protein, partial [Acutalibacteraceae bacterium]